MGIFPSIMPFVANNPTTALAENSGVSARIFEKTAFIFGIPVANELNSSAADAVIAPPSARQNMM